MDAVDNPDDGEPLPAELKLRWLCETWGGLPETGAIMDQDYRTLYRGSLLDNIYKVVARTRGLKGAQIHSLTKAERRLLRWLRDMEML